MTKMLAATTHLGSENSETTMEQYIFKKRVDGVNIINLKMTWEKMLLAARAIAGKSIITLFDFFWDVLSSQFFSAFAAIENPADVFVVSSRPYGQRAVLKFARYIGSTPIAGRFTPGKTYTFYLKFTRNVCISLVKLCSSSNPILDLCKIVRLILFLFPPSELRCIHQSDPGRFPRAPPDPDRWPQGRPSARHWGKLR